MIGVGWKGISGVKTIDGKEDKSDVGVDSPPTADKYDKYDKGVDLASGSNIYVALITDDIIFVGGVIIVDIFCVRKSKGIEPFRV